MEHRRDSGGRGSVSIYMLTSLKYTAELHEMSRGSDCLHGQQLGLFFSKS